ncbi:hypothetical protein UMZ34_25820 [Halopseudomonas pachastrellae]|nr:hypothetical protein UMZ34_25820 [Halopseudomonas pachastrellae]
MESGNDAMHLLNVPPSLETVRGGLVFLGMTRAANVIHMAASFIRETMLERKQVPQDAQLEVLADALTSIEFYLESAERAAVATGDDWRWRRKAWLSSATPYRGTPLHEIFPAV